MYKKSENISGRSIDKSIDKMFYIKVKGSNIENIKKCLGTSLIEIKEVLKPESESEYEADSEYEAESEHEAESEYETEPNSDLEYEPKHKVKFNLKSNSGSDSEPEEGAEEAEEAEKNKNDVKTFLFRKK